MNQDKSELFVGNWMVLETTILSDHKSDIEV